jgi:hypothetical protein
LKADADESFLVKDIQCVPSSNDTYLTLMTQSTTVGKFRVKGLGGNHLPYRCIKTAAIYEAPSGGLLNRLRRAGAVMLGLVGLPSDGGLDAFLKNPLDIRFPVASGETFTVSRYAEAGNVAVVYDIYEAADVKPDLPNGTQSKVRRYLHYATNAASAADGDCAVGTSYMWSGGDGWPFDGSSVAEGNQFALTAIMGLPVGKGASAANKGYSTHLKLMQRGNVLFDEDAKGLPFLGDTSALSAGSIISYGSVIGDCTAENPTDPLVLDPALVFPEGETLTSKIVIAGYASGGPGAAELSLAYALERTYL